MEERILQIALHHRANLNSGDIHYAADTLRYLPHGTSQCEKVESAWWQGLRDAGWTNEEIMDFMCCVSQSLGEHRRRR